MHFPTKKLGVNFFHQKRPNQGGGVRGGFGKRPHIFRIFFRQPSLRDRDQTHRSDQGYLGPINTVYIKNCFIVQVKFSQGFAFPKSCNKRDNFSLDHLSSRCLFSLWSIHRLGSLVGVPGGQTYCVFLEGDSREQHCHKLQTHNIMIFSWPEICLFGHEIYQSPKREECTFEIKTTCTTGTPRDRICLGGTDYQLHLSLGNVTWAYFL